MPHIIEHSDSYAFFVCSFFFSHRISLMGFRTLLYLKATHHYSSNEANDQVYQIVSPNYNCSLVRKAALIGVRGPQDRLFVTH